MRCSFKECFVYRSHQLGLGAEIDAVCMFQAQIRGSVACGGTGGLQRVPGTCFPPEGDCLSHLGPWCGDKGQLVQGWPGALACQVVGTWLLLSEGTGLRGWQATAVSRGQALLSEASSVSLKPVPLRSDLGHSRLCFSFLEA